MHKSIEIVSERNSIFRQRVQIEGFDDLYTDVPVSIGGEWIEPYKHD